MANLLNHSVFPHSGPVKRLAEVLGATGEYAGECLLQNILPPGYDTEKAIFPVSDLEASSKPLVKGRYDPDLHLAIGCLRMFDATQNSAQPDGEPQCNFHSQSSDYIKGAAFLDPYGPMFWPIIRSIVPALSPMLGELFCNPKTVEDVAASINRDFKR